MTTLVPTGQGDVQLANDVLAHLELQLVAARRLLGVVLDQGAAIRAREVRTVVQLAGLLQAELERRKLLESERVELLERSGARLGVGSGAVTLELLTGLMDADTAELARARSAELRGLLEVLRREHYCNRALMTQELAFLDHLLGLAGTAASGYDAAGDRVAGAVAAITTGHRVLDLEA
jgi:hypothetical protein